MAYSKNKITHHTLTTLRIYLKYLGHHKLATGSVVLFIIIATIAAELVPLYFKQFFDLLSANATSPTKGVASDLILILFGIGGIELIRWVSWRIATLINNRLQPRVMRELSEHCFTYLHRHSFNYFNNTFIGSLVKQVNRFVNSFESIMDTIVWSIIPFITTIAVILYVISARNYWLGLILVGWIVIFLLINWIMTIIKIKYDVAHSEAETATSGLLADTMSNHSAVKLFNGYIRETKRFSELVERVRHLNRVTWDLEALFDALQGILIIALEIGMFYIAIRLWQQKILTVGDFVLIQAYLLSLFLEIWGFGRLIRRIFENLANADDMTATLITPHEIQDIPQAAELSASHGQIEFKHVSFAYQISATQPITMKTGDSEPTEKKSERIIFSDLNFTIKPQEKIALVTVSRLKS
jgi:ATP-binding cassette subfamily B protein